MGPNRTSYLEAPPSGVHLVYNCDITQACRVKHLEPLSANGLFVHLLEVRQNSFKIVVFIPFEDRSIRDFCTRTLSVACVQLKFTTLRTT